MSWIVYFEIHGITCAIEENRDNMNHLFGLLSIGRAILRAARCLARQNSFSQVTKRRRFTALRHSVLVKVRGTVYD